MKNLIPLLNCQLANSFPTGELVECFVLPDDIAMLRTMFADPIIASQLSNQFVELSKTGIETIQAYLAVLDNEGTITGEPLQKLQETLLIWREQVA